MKQLKAKIILNKETLKSSTALIGINKLKPTKAKRIRTIWLLFRIKTRAHKMEALKLLH